MRLFDRQISNWFVIDDEIVSFIFIYSFISKGPFESSLFGFEVFVLRFTDGAIWFAGWIGESIISLDIGIFYSGKVMFGDSEFDIFFIEEF